MHKQHACTRALIAYFVDRLLVDRPLLACMMYVQHPHDNHAFPLLSKCGKQLRPE